MTASPLWTLTVAAPEEAGDALATAMTRIEALTQIHETRTLAEGIACDIDVSGADAVLAGVSLAALFGDLPVDWCFQPAARRRKALLVADMDSTIIGCECLDELADFAGVKAEVAAITERAMRGELVFEEALRARVKMIAGLPLDVLQQCYEARVSLNPGAETLVRTMNAHGAHTVLVSGGFSFFTSRVAARAGFREQRANDLMDDGATLTGRVREPILGRAAKLSALLDCAGRFSVGPLDALAIGDGANDLSMIQAAGLGVAYRAKPAVAEAAGARIDHTDLRTALWFQGYRADELAV